MILNKQVILELKNNPAKLAQVIKTQNDANGINFILENLGKLPKDFNGHFLYDLLSHSQQKVRVNAAKTIGKSKIAEGKILIRAFYAETDSVVKREIVSAIGRQRDLNYKDFLLETLSDPDPKIVCQAIRGLLVFKNDESITCHLQNLMSHDNEMVRAVVSAYFAQKNKPKNIEISPLQFPEFIKNVIVNADVLATLPHIPDESVHLTFTSPPYYNARDYSIYPSYQAYLEFLAHVFKAVHRITKEGRFLIVNTSPIIVPRMSRAHSSQRYAIPFDLHPYLLNNGWVFIDDIIWLKPEASVKNRIGSFMQHRNPLSYKPNTVTEYLMVYRKQTEKLIDWNIKQYPQETVNQSKVSNAYESTNVWRIDPCFDKVHSAVFPAELCKRVIEYYSYRGDLIFDPFGGSGTVAKTAKALDRFFFLTEQNQVYFEYMKNKPDFVSARFLTLSPFIELACLSKV